MKARCPGMVEYDDQHCKGPQAIDFRTIRHWRLPDCNTHKSNYWISLDAPQNYPIGSRSIHTWCGLDCNGQRPAVRDALPDGLKDAVGSIFGTILP
jgi:hypothetical protein